jgi:hypothetical protein
MGKAVVAPGPTVLMVGEDRIGVLRRIKACQVRHNKPIPRGRLYISSTRIEVDKKGTDAVKAELEHISNAVGASPSLLVVDTLNRALPSGASENDPKDMASFINLVDSIRDAFGCVCLIVHHTGHTEKDRSRGHSSFKAALDFELCVSRRGGVRVAEWTKMKNLPDEPRPQEFILEPVLVDATEDGELVRSAVVSWKGQASSRATVATTKVEMLGLNTLRTASVTSGGLAASLEAWRPLFYAGHWGDNDAAKQKAFRRTRESLLNKGLVRVNEDKYMPENGGLS